MGVLAARRRLDSSALRPERRGETATTIVPRGVTHTPKQICLDVDQVQALLGRLRGHAHDARQPRRLARSRPQGRLRGCGRRHRQRRRRRKWCVGDGHRSHARGQFYWTQKAAGGAGDAGRILRARVIEIPLSGETAGTRCDIDPCCGPARADRSRCRCRAKRVLYWTDRGDPPARQYRRIARPIDCEGFDASGHPG